MTLSVLIPTYNYDAHALVHAMVRLAKVEGIDAEVIVGDDASTSETEWMSEVEHEEGVRVIHAPTNLGRARIRNFLADAAEGEWLLIVDADAAVPETFSLKKYLEAGAAAPVVCGGLYHPDVNPNPEATLRYKYERNADRYRAATVRSQHPHRKLSTFNLLVRRDVFLTIRFDERCTDYGYEDALFGAQLGVRGIPVAHIDNPLVHMGLESNWVFLAKTETAMHTLHRIGHLMPHDFGILHAVHQLQRYHLTGVVRWFYRIFHQPMRANLLSHSPSLLIFKLYKLGFFLSI